MKQEATNLERRWLEFIQAHGRPCFVGWPAEITLAWLRWHAGQRTLIVTHTDDVINGLLIGWQCRRERLEQHWQANDPAGDCLYLAHAVATAPQATAEGLAWVNKRWPHWRKLNIFWRRAGRGLVPVPEQAIYKLYSRAQRRVREGNTDATRRAANGQ